MLHALLHITRALSPIAMPGKRMYTNVEKRGKVWRAKDGQGCVAGSFATAYQAACALAAARQRPAPARAADDCEGVEDAADPAVRLAHILRGVSPSERDAVMARATDLASQPEVVVVAPITTAAVDRDNALTPIVREFYLELWKTLDESVHISRKQMYARYHRWCKTDAHKCSQHVFTKLFQTVAGPGVTTKLAREKVKPHPHPKTYKLVRSVPVLHWVFDMADCPAEVLDVYEGNSEQRVRINRSMAHKPARLQSNMYKSLRRMGELDRIKRRSTTLVE